MMAAVVAMAALVLCYLIYAAWLSPSAARRRLRRAGFDGPRPSFPLGNLPEITATTTLSANSSSKDKEADMHAAVFPYFARWRRSFGKVFVYWLGTEPFLYVADPGFLKAATAGALGKRWGKPDVFRRDRMPMFGRGLVMAEGHDWARHRNIIAPAFSATNLAGMVAVMQRSTAGMLDRWAAHGGGVIDVEEGVVRNAAEIIARASFGIGDEGDHGERVFQKLQAMQAMLFTSNRLVGVPMARLLHLRRTYEAWKLGREIDALLMDIIDQKRRRGSAAESPSSNSSNSKDLLSLLLSSTGSGALTTRELVDECKTFFFGGHETTALALSWTLLKLAEHPEWQDALREEVMLELGEEDGDAGALGRLTKMGWVMSEVLRLYPPSPNVQRQALEDVDVVVPASPEKQQQQQTMMTIPRGTNMWVDVVAMHRDPALWGDDAHQFRPERFARDSVQGGCRQRMGFVPFGFGGRICVGRNLTAMEYRVVLAMVLRRFRLSVAPQYQHKPRVMLSLRPSAGIQLHLTPLSDPASI